MAVKSLSFDLGIYVQPGGTVYCNRMAYKWDMDYKEIAFIDTEGNLTLYVPAKSIPGTALLRIEHDADATRSNFLAKYNQKSDLEKFSFLCDRVTIRQFLDMPRKGATLEDKIEYLEKAYGIRTI